MSPTLLALAALVVLLAVKYWKSFKDDLVWNTLPGPSYKIPIIGNFDKIRWANTSEHLSKWAEQYGPVFRFYVMGKSRVMVSDPATVKYVLLNNHLFDKNLLQYKLLARGIGHGLVTQDDEGVHKYHRSIVSPAFALKHLKGLVPIFQRKATLLVEDWVKVAGSGKPVSIKEDISRATSDVIGEAAFGYQLNSQRDNSPSSVYNILSLVIGGGINFFEAIPLLGYLVPGYKRRLAARQALDGQVHAILTQKTETRAQESHKKRKETKREEEGEEEERDLLDILMDCQNEEGAMLTQKELCEQTKTFLLAGFETSSTCILWTMYLLAKYKDIQEKVAEEIISVIGKDRKPTAEDIDKMPYLYKVLRESLRYRPPIPFVARRVAEDVTLNGYHIPKGTSIVVNIFHQHHHSPVWVNPEKFDPERWSTDEAESNTLLGSYIPFILGARNCIGSRFAMLEVRVMLAMIMQKLRFEREPGVPEVGTRPRVAMVPSSPIRLLLSARN